MTQQTLRTIIPQTDNTVSDLKKILERFNAKKLNLKKAELEAKLEQLLLQTQPVQLLKLFSKEEALVLAEAAYDGGSVDVSYFEAKHSVNFPDFRRYISYYDKDAKMSLMRVLCYGYDGTYFFAEDFLKHIMGHLEDPTEENVETVAKLPDSYTVEVRRGEKEERPIHVFSGQETALPELLTVLDLVASGKIKVTPKKKRPSTATEKLVTKNLLTPDFLPDAEGYEPVRAHAWVVLAQQCGWCKPYGSKLVLTRSGKQMRLEPEIENFKKGFDAFIKSKDFDEFNRIEAIKGQTLKGRTRLTSVGDRKLAIFQAMHMWPKGWIDFDKAFHSLFTLGAGYEVSRHNWDLYFESREYGSLAYADRPEAGTKKQYARALFMESLATLGCLDIAYVTPDGLWPEFKDSWGTDCYYFCSQYDGLLYVRLNDCGAYLLGINAYYKPPARNDKLFKLLANHDLVLNSPNLSPIDENHIEKIAKKSGELTYHLEKSLILKYIEEGASLEDIISFLERRSENEVPKVVLTFLKTTQTKIITPKQMSEVILLDIKADSVAALIAHDTTAKKYCQLLGSTHLAINKNQIKQFNNAVQKMGYAIPSLKKQYDV